MVDQQLPAGNHTYIWSGENNANLPVASGVYFYLMKTGDYIEMKKMLLLK